jgi:RNA polymerase sigma-70 factor, ECF subfamily
VPGVNWADRNGCGTVTPRASLQAVAQVPPGREVGELELLESVACGDQHAFKRLYLLYHRRLGGFLMRMTGRHDLTEELINDVMFVVWKKAGSFRAESQVSTWIFGIAYRQALKALRSNRNRPRPDRLNRNHEACEPAEADGAERQETCEWVAHALAELPPKQRMVIELAYFMGYSCEEIARVAECPVGTVKTRMHHARARLRGVLSSLAGARNDDSGQEMS